MPKQSWLSTIPRRCDRWWLFTWASAGYQVVEAGNGKEAVGKVNGGTKPDLVVTDLNMPEMDGISLIKEIRKMPA